MKKNRYLTKSINEEEKTILLKELYRSGNILECKKELYALTLHFSKLSENLKNLLITFFLVFRDFENAYKFLGPELDQDAFATCSEEQLKRQILIAHFKLETGSHLKGASIMKKIMDACIKRKNLSETAIVNVLNFVFNILSHTYNTEIEVRYKDFLKLEAIFPDLFNDSTKHRILLYQIYYAKAFSNVEKRQYYLDKLLEIANDTNSPIVVRENSFDLWYSIKTYFNLLTIEEHLHYVRTNSVDNCNDLSRTIRLYYYITAFLHFNKKEEAKKLLTEFCIPKDKPAIVLSFLYFKSLLTPEELTFDEAVFLKLSPYHSIDAHFLGNFKFTNYYPFPVQLELMPSQKNVGENCFYLCKNTISKVHYRSFIFEKDIVDLYSGLIYKNGEVVCLLSSLRVKVLKLIIGSSYYGIHVDFLIEEMLSGSKIFPNSAILRINNLVMELKKLGFKIHRKHNFYYFNFKDNNYSIIFPENHQTKLPLEYLKKSHDVINIKNISQTLNIKRSTASKYLAEWKSLNLLQPIPGERGEYIFK